MWFTFLNHCHIPTEGLCKVIYEHLILKQQLLSWKQCKTEVIRLLLKTTNRKSCVVEFHNSQ